MTLTGSGVGGNIGGPQIPTQRDLEATAWTENDKAYLAIVKDNLEKSFTQLIQRYTSGESEFFGRYMSNESRPLLDHPLENIRVSQGFEALVDETWQSVYDDLFNQLPPEIQKNLTQEQQKPLNERNSDFVALNNLLANSAKLLAKIGLLSQPLAPDSIVNARTELNQLMPLFALEGMISQGFEIQDSLTAKNLARGPNYYHFDDLNNFLAQNGAILNDLQNLLGEIKSGGDAQTVARMAALAVAINKLNAAYQKSGFRDEMQILGPTLNAMEILSSAWSLAESGSPSLFIGLSIASTGISSNSSDTGIFGTGYTLLMKALANGLQTTVLSQANIGQAKLLALLIQTGSGFLVGSAYQILKSGLGNFPNTDQASLRASQQFTAELALNFLQSSGFLKTIFETMLNASKADDSAKANGAETIAQTAILFTLFSLASQSAQDPTELVAGQQSYLEKGIQASADISSKQETSSDITANAVQVALQQSQMALQNKDFEGFVAAFSSLLENMGTSQEELKEDFKTINDASNTIFKSMTAEPQESVTGIISIV